jgi:putative hydrolase of the HAD superfamily
VAAAPANSCGSKERARSAVTAWSELLPLVDLELVDLLTRVRDVASVALVSNGTTRLEQDLARQGPDRLAHLVGLPADSRCRGDPQPPRVRGRTPRRTL